MSRNPEQHLYDSLVSQSQQGSWSKGFDLREFEEDPWSLGIFDPENVHFEAPADQKDRIPELQDTLYGIVRPFLIQDKPWEELVGVFNQVLTNTDVEKFAEERQANIIAVTPHTMFADLGITAGAAREVMTQLDPDHPFGTNGDPREKQTIVAGRILSMLKHGDLSTLTGGLPLLEGMMLPLAGVTTTHSANGSSLYSKVHLGQSQVRKMNDITRSSMETHMTHGNFIFHEALHGSQVKWEDGGYARRRVMEKVSDGTRDMILTQNLGHAATHKNIVVCITLDCPSFDRNGGYSPQDAGVGVVPEVFVPTEPHDFDLIMRAMAEYATLHRQPHLPGFIYNNQPPLLDDKEINRLREITLTDLRDTA
ncbi:hypothetical protein KDA00_05010 [Candidatus Saccharibacteria bacterium]|nr:hypothetical protein [Candidatus Saccharibacteria bacterium]